MEAALATNPSLTSLPRKPEILAPVDLEQTTGTGEILRLEEVQKSITSDFIILPCDLVSELDGNKILQQWMTLNPLSSSSKKRKGALAVFYPTHGLEGISNKNDETDFIATVPLPRATVPAPQGSLRPDIESLVMHIPKDSLKDRIEEDNGVFKLRVQLTQKYGRVKLKMKHRDAHVYIFPKWVKDYAARNPRFDSISEDVLGWWAKAQWQSGLGEKLGMDEVFTQEPSSASSEDMENSQHLQEDSDEESTSDAAQLSSTKVSHLPGGSRKTFASRVRGVTAPISPSQFEVPALQAYIQPDPTPSTPLIRRVDTSPALLSISLHIAKQQSPAHSLAHDHKQHPSATVGLQTRITYEDSLIAENVAIGIRCAIKESVVGANCEIGNGVRLTRCLLMDGVVVGDGVQLVGCVVGRRARIEGLKPAAVAEDSEKAKDGEEKGKGKKKRVEEDEDEKTKLTECEVAPNFVVKAGTEAKGEKMMAELEGMDDEEDEDENDVENEEL